MKSLTPAENETIRDLVSLRRESYGLPGEFYRDDLVYRAEIQRIWRRGWLFAGHTCEIPEPGDYFTFQLDTDSVIVVRGDDGNMHALHNVCRHRGTIICDKPSGHVGRFVCPYHQWTYDRDGTLVSCRGMQNGLDKEQLGLLPAHVRIL